MRCLVSHCLVIGLLLTTDGPIFGAVPASRQAVIGSAAAETAINSSAASSDARPLSNPEKQGFGCLAVGGAAMALGAFAGFDELVLVFGGGGLAPTTTTGHVIAVAGMIFASFCAVGALATPAIVRLWNDYYGNGGTVPAR